MKTIQKYKIIGTANIFIFPIPTDPLHCIAFTYAECVAVGKIFNVYASGEKFCNNLNKQTWANETSLQQQFYMLR